jgi:hypothetical protein
MRIRIQLFTLMRIRILLLIKVMGICYIWAVDPLGLYCELLHFDLNADSDPAFHSNANTYPDPPSKNNAGPDPQLSTCRSKHLCFGTGSRLDLVRIQIQAGKMFPK